jgi:three-Cys-motif partner protein
MARRKDRWPELCELVAADDNLPVREVGKWTEDKLYTWNRYIEITTTAMATNPSWPGGLVYVDLFGGPGVCRRENGKRIPGSALIAANAPKSFGTILVCEKEPEIAEALNRRLRQFGIPNGVIVGDCNAEIGNLVARIPPRSLTLAFVDPEGLHVNFETLRILTIGRQIDLAVLFADRMDIVRNVALYADQSESNLDRFLGPTSDWRIQWQNLGNQNPGNICQLFGDIFRSQLEKELGFTEFSDTVYKAGQISIYRIIYASKHPLGGKFWNEISKIERGGQQSMF